MLLRTWHNTPRLRTLALPKLQEAATPAEWHDHKQLSRSLHKRVKPVGSPSSTSVKVKVPRNATKAKVEKAASALPKTKGFLYVAIDGDACPFHQDYTVRGRKGGWMAAERLIKDVKHIFGLASDDLTDVIIQIFLNQRGHSSYAWHKYRVHTEVSTAFYEGLNQADPFLNLVNVGHQKEAADHKIRAGLQFHLSHPGCERIALAGLSDGGYAGVLRSFISRGQRDKVVLLKTSTSIAADIKEIANGLAKEPDDYGLPVAPLPSDLFQPEALPPPPTL